MRHQLLRQELTVKQFKWKKVLFFLLAALSFSSATAQGELKLAVDWPAFMDRHDLFWKKLPAQWTESPYLGNGNMGTMLYREDNSIRLQMFRTDVQDHRDNTYGWTAYSRPRFMVGSFYLNPVGKIKGGSWRMDLWNAELTGTIKTDRGTIVFRHLVHTKEMVAAVWSSTTGSERPTLLLAHLPVQPSPPGPLARATAQPAAADSDR